MTMDEIAASMKDRVAASGFSRSVKFDCGGGDVLVIDGTSISTADADTECTITVDKDDFEAIVSGDLDPTSAFMQGKLKVDGDMSVAMALSQVL